MNRKLQELYEKTLINEVAGALNYWLTPNGQLLKVHDLIDYAIKNLNIPFEIDPDEYYPINSDGSIAEEDDVYESIFYMGYIRVVEDTANIYFTYSDAKKPTKEQFMVLYGMSEDKNKNLVDGNTEKVIVKKNEIESDVAGNEKVRQMDQDLQPDFYKQRGRYSEGFSKFGMSDYTKLLS